MSTGPEVAASLIAVGGSGRRTCEGRTERRVEVALLICVAAHAIKTDRRSESLDSFYKIRLYVTRNKSYLDVRNALGLLCSLHVSWLYTGVLICNRLHIVLVQFIYEQDYN